MRRTRQHIYASNLLHEPHLGGYPLRNPSPKDKSDLEGLQVGDVGYVDGDGKFNRVLNIRFPPPGLQDRIPSYDFSLPIGVEEFKPKKVIMAGVRRIPNHPRYLHICR